jgi:hypothetical protein
MESPDPFASDENFGDEFIDSDFDSPTHRSAIDSLKQEVKDLNLTLELERTTSKLAIDHMRALVDIAHTQNAKLLSHIHALELAFDRQEASMSYNLDVLRAENERLQLQSPPQQTSKPKRCKNHPYDK